MKLFTTALLALMAVAEAQPLASSTSPALSTLADARADSLVGSCTNINLFTERSGTGIFENYYQVEGTCGGVVTTVDLNPCIYNDKGTMKFGKEYVSPDPFSIRSISC